MTKQTEEIDVLKLAPIIRGLKKLNARELNYLSYQVVNAQNSLTGEPK